MPQKVVIYGAGQTGIGIAELIRQEYQSIYEVVGFIDDSKKEHTYPIPILGDSSNFKHIKNEGRDRLILGFINPVEERLKRGLELLSMGFKFPSLYQHDLGNTWGVYIGRGVLIYRATISTNVKLGDFVAIGPYSNIEPSEISEGVVITSQVFVGTGSSIGKGTLIYPGTKILPDVRVGEYCIIGPNAIVHKDLPDRTRYVRH